jgi:hypothetical protein
MKPKKPHQGLGQWHRNMAQRNRDRAPEWDERLDEQFAKNKAIYTKWKEGAWIPDLAKEFEMTEVGIGQIIRRIQSQMGGLDWALRQNSKA